MQVVNISVKKILPDENQPRKYFPANKMYNLKQSIKRLGIKEPLNVEEIGKDKYIITDGERRFRASLELGLKEVPCIVEQPHSELERLIRQFHLQEQHESWTPIEKAMATLNVSKALNTTVVETCNVLAISSSDISKYIAFAELVDKETYIKNEIPLDLATYIKALKAKVRRITVDVLEEEFDRNEEKHFEQAVIRQIVLGTIRRRADLVRLGDAFTKKPELIQKFLKSEKATPDALFVEAKAKGVVAFRNMLYSSNHAFSHANVFLAHPDVKPNEDQMKKLKATYRALGDVIKMCD